MNQPTNNEQLTTRAIDLYNTRAVNFDEFNDILRIIKEHEAFASKFITTIERVAKKTTAPIEPTKEAIK